MLHHKLKVFTDTSVLISGLKSPFGASSFILILFKLKQIELIISKTVVEEAKNVIKNKFPDLKNKFVNFLFIDKPKIIKEASKNEVLKIFKIIKTEDAPILADALNSKADFLITLDKRFINIAKNYFEDKINILLPKDFVCIYRKTRQN
jgi:putative PIN family toxin of toxin-antitoxin system